MFKTPGVSVECQTRAPGRFDLLRIYYNNNDNKNPNSCNNAALNNRAGSALWNPVKIPDIRRHICNFFYTAWWYDVYTYFYSLGKINLYYICEFVIYLKISIISWCDQLFSLETEEQK